MTQEKFKSEISTLREFILNFCENKHNNQFTKKYSIKYRNDFVDFEISLCKECHELMKYSFDRLIECPHDIKPRCRQCPSPCYEKQEWKSLAKIMRYSGIKLGLIKIKNKFKIKIEK